MAPEACAKRGVRQSGRQRHGAWGGRRHVLGLCLVDQLLHALLRHERPKAAVAWPRWPGLVGHARRRGGRTRPGRCGQEAVGWVAGQDNELGGAMVGQVLPNCCLQPAYPTHQGHAATLRGAPGSGVGCLAVHRRPVPLFWIAAAANKAVSASFGEPLQSGSFFLAALLFVHLPSGPHLFAAGRGEELSAASHKAPSAEHQPAASPAPT